MGFYKNFKTVVYCVSEWAQHVTKEQLLNEIAFFQKYVGVDKVYLEPFRGTVASKEQIIMIKDTFTENGIEVAGGITTVTPNLNDEDAKRQRLFTTFCYSNEPMRNRLKEMVEYTASFFDEFIIDDFYFTQCMCEDCQKEKGDRSWEDYRLGKMVEVSNNLVLGPAKAVNPNVKVTIKFPNWMESYQETGYNPAIQTDMFDMIYTGTETRHAGQTDQHLPRYLSYSLMRYMENHAPSKNGGGWFDPFECYPIDTYLEQAYLTAFSRPREMMMFCWSALYNNKVVTPLGFQMQKIDEILTEIGKPIGLPVYLPHNAQGEDHLEDYLGMAGIPFEPTPVFDHSAKEIFLTSAALNDVDIVDKLKNYVREGGKAVVTSGFMIEALNRGLGIEEMTSIRYRGRRNVANEYMVANNYKYGMNVIYGKETIEFPVLEHRNNASWSLINAGSGDHHASILLKDTYGKGLLLTLVVPDMYSSIKKLPDEVLAKIRFELLGEGEVYLEAPAQISLFTFDDDTFGIYSYTADHCRPLVAKVHVMKQVKELLRIGDRKEVIKPLYQTEFETVFEVPTMPGDYSFYRLS